MPSRPATAISCRPESVKRPADPTGWPLHVLPQGCLEALAHRQNISVGVLEPGGLRSASPSRRSRRGRCLSGRALRARPSRRAHPIAESLAGTARARECARRTLALARTVASGPKRGGVRVAVTGRASRVSSARSPWPSSGLFACARSAAPGLESRGSSERSQPPSSAPPRPSFDRGRCRRVTLRRDSFTRRPSRTPPARRRRFVGGTAGFHAPPRDDPAPRATRCVQP